MTRFYNQNVKSEPQKKEMVLRKTKSTGKGKI